MNVSIIIAVLDSHEIVRRQILHCRRLDLPEAVEIIIVDDGSEPAIANPEPLRNCHILQTGDFRRWTQGLARMKGIDAAQGEYIFCTDIDHIITRDAIDAALAFDGDKMNFRRHFAYLDEEGQIVTDYSKVVEWGLNEAAIRDKATLASGFHGNTWLMRKQVFNDLGRYNLERCNSGTHLQGEDREFNKRWANAVRTGKVKPEVVGPPIYFFPIGRFHKTGDENPHGLFHSMHKEKWDVA